MTMEGILPVWKAVNYTSHDVVAKVRRILGIKRIGHTGTLDPMVTGVLPLCIGRATRVVEYIQELPKEYEAKLIVGLSTDTEDLTGSVTEEVSQVNLTEDEVLSVVSRFQGDIEQVPPMYSAVKVEGKRLYELARQGETVERKARTVTIYSIEVTSMKLQQDRPEIGLRVLCSKGTYIRTLCSDIGKALGYPAAMGGLIRTGTGGISAERCYTLEQVEQMKRDGTIEGTLIPIDEAISHFPRVSLSEIESKHALQGKTLPFENKALLSDGDLENGVPLVRAYDPGNRFLGIFRIHPDEKTMTPEKVFLPDETAGTGR